MATKETSKPELRREERTNVMALQLKATLALVEGDEARAFLVLLKDVSKSGVGVFSKLETPEHTPVRFSLENSSQPPLNGRIAFCKRTLNDLDAPPTHPFRVGIEFLPADDAAREQQLQFVHTLTNRGRQGAKFGK